LGNFRLKEEVLKKIYLILCIAIAIMLTSCGLVDVSNAEKQANFQREAQSVKYSSEYATTINKLELNEANFNSYRKVVFYNVRLGENVFVCEGYCHVQVDSDGDIELVIKTGPGQYLRHYLGQKQDITYFSEQLDPNVITNNDRYRVIWNPKLWIPAIN
jgi:hypothetical protein